MATRETWAFARQVAATLPRGVAAPEFADEPDGCVALDWIGPHRAMVSVSVIAGSRSLPYAWVVGAAKGHGVATFDGAVFPLEIVRVIELALRKRVEITRAAINKAQGT